LYSIVKYIAVFFLDVSTLSLLRMQNLTDLVVTYLMTLFQLQGSDSVECGGELIMNGYRYTAVLPARVGLL
jgi:hypothetical protein